MRGNENRRLRDGEKRLGFIEKGPYQSTAVSSQLLLCCVHVFKLVTYRPSQWTSEDASCRHHRPALISPAYVV